MIVAYPVGRSNFKVRVIGCVYRVAGFSRGHRSHQVVVSDIVVVNLVQPGPMMTRQLSQRWPEDPLGKPERVRWGSSRDHMHT